MSEAYTMPPVQAGEPVLYYPGGNTSLKPHVGFVSAVNPQNVCVHLLSGESHNFLIRDGVRHVSDPALAKNPHAREDGAWDYHPLHGRLAALEAKVAELVRLVG